MTDRITDTRTHKENIDKLSVQGGPFDAWGANSTYQKAIDPLSEDASLTKERKELHKRLLDKYKETHGYDNIDTERKTIMMAGAPGAGKSTTLKRALDGSPDTYLPIDPDAFKVLLIEEVVVNEVVYFCGVEVVPGSADAGCSSFHTPRVPLLTFSLRFVFPANKLINRLGTGKFTNIVALTDLIRRTGAKPGTNRLNTFCFFEHIGQLIFTDTKPMGEIVWGSTGIGEGFSCTVDF